MPIRTVSSLDNVNLYNINTFSSINNRKRFCLDTNVLYWYTYPRYGLGEKNNKHHSQVYYDFVDKLVADGNPLITTIYNVSELLNIVEKHEWEIYKRLNPQFPIDKKDYRRIASERTNLQQIMKTTISNVKNICTIVDFNFSSEGLDCYVDSFTKHRCDVFDYLILNYYVESSDINIISDDNDFVTYPGINLYTANRKSLEELTV